MTLNELNEIIKNFRAECDYLNKVYAEREKEKHELFIKYGFVKICKRDLPGDDLNRYKNLTKVVEQLEKQIEKNDVIKKFVNDYIFNVYNALAFNYYAQELSKRPKTHGKPSHYKVVKDALKEIRENMPEDIKENFYGVATIYAGGRWYSMSDFFPSDGLRVPEQIPLELENPVELAEKNYKAYEKITDILRKAYGDILTIEKGEISTPFGQRGNMQYSNIYSPAEAVEMQAFHTLPAPLYRELHLNKN